MSSLAACEITLSKPHHCLILLFIASKGSHTLRDHPAHTSRRKHSLKCSWTPSNYNPNEIQHIKPCDFGTSKPFKINSLFRGALCCQSTVNWTRHFRQNSAATTPSKSTRRLQHLTNRLACRPDPGRAFFDNKEVNISSLFLNPQNHPKSYVITLWIWECWSSLSRICYDFLRNSYQELCGNSCLWW